MSKQYNKKRKVYRLDPTTSNYYVYGLFFSDDKNNIELNHDNIFYIGKAKNKEFPCLRRENKHMEEAYQRSHENFHKSRKIKKLENDGNYILSAILENFDDENSAYEGEYKWYYFYKNRGNDLTNMIECGLASVGSGENHPSYDFEIRKHVDEIVKLYVINMLSIDKISKIFKKSSKIIKEILKTANVKFREKNIRNPLWLKKYEIIEKYNSGLSLNQLHAEYGASANFFADMLRSENIEIRKSNAYTRAIDLKYVDQIIKMYNDVPSYNKIADYFKCDPCVIKRILDNNNISKKKQSHPIWNKLEEIKNKKNTGMSCVELALEYNVSVQMIYKILK
jgi:hypothetical protein